MPPKKRVAIGKISSAAKKKRLERKKESPYQRNKRLADARRRAFISRTSKTPEPVVSSVSSSMESLREKNAAFNALLQCTPVMDNLLFDESKKKYSRCRRRKHPGFNKGSKMQRIRRVRERLVGLLEQKYAEWQQKYSQRNSGIQNVPVTKIKKILDPIECNMDDINSFADFLMFDEPVREIMNSMVKYVESQFIEMDGTVQKREYSECSENEAANYDFLHNSATKDLSCMNDSQAFLPYIKKEVDEDATFSDESYNILHGEIKLETSVKIETDSQSSFHSEDEILSVNSLQLIDQENTSPLNKNHEISDSSNVSCTTNCSTEYAEKNENCDGKSQFIKLEFQEVNCYEGEKNCDQETDLESMYHKTSSLVKKKRKIFFPALHVSPKWKTDRVTDYSRANRDISNEKLAVNECVTSNFSHLSQNPVISRDVSEENQTSGKTKRLKKKDKLKKKRTKESLKKKSICIKRALFNNRTNIPPHIALV
ncbi:uncharacterized protein TNCV_1283351 [Trichonephila clavipes]|uniref:Uncharacterized protein n=1 Tax=Trichonephila clavipes TaxID=2585209 RepID=A0A8X6SQQ2_TRICX|nr:uncharacterized protein TNCV_1283351 [Trichonephila clavipes]